MRCLLTFPALRFRPTLPTASPGLQVDDQENVVPPMAEELRMQIQHTNMQVMNLTTPANYFHALRRQVHRAFRKPLIIATPKSLLRHKSAVSSIADMGEGSVFQRVIPDTHAALVAPKKVRKLLLCCGKVYYELEKARADGGHHDVAIARVEQIAPFPFDLVAAEVKKFPGASVAWVQEEPRNMGAWSYVAPRIESATRVLLGKEVRPVSGSGSAGHQVSLPSLTAALRLSRLTSAVASAFALLCLHLASRVYLHLVFLVQSYAGRLAAASPAAGSSKIHDAEQAKLIADAFA